jgi:hypothetical protein
VAEGPETLSDYVEVLGRIYLRERYVDIDFLGGFGVVWDDREIVCCQAQESVDFISRVGTCSKSET